MADSPIYHPARELTAHRVNGLNEALRVFVLDQPGSGGACHDYVVLVPAGADTLWPAAQPDIYTIATSPTEERLLMWRDRAMVVSADRKDSVGPLYIPQRIRFQNGPVKESGYNGNSHEALLAILLDRLEGFQAGQYKNHDNQMALDHLQTARLFLHKRTMDRVARGVEGTNKA
jgi:hypothetical protein